MVDTPRGPASVDESWQDYRLLADNAIDVVLEADLTTQIRWVSPSVEDVLGWRPDELVGRSAPELVHPEDMDEIGALVQALNEQVAPVRSRRVRLRARDGSWRALQLRGRPAVDSGGNVAGHIIAMQDTTERDDALRALAVLTEGNRLLSRAEDEGELLDGVCDAIARIGEYALAWFGERVDDERRSVRIRAAAGPECAYATDLSISWADVPTGRGPAGTCLRTGETKVYNDLAASSGFEPWRDRAAQHGLGSCIALPVVVDHDVIGTLMVYARDATAFDRHARELLETLASDLGFGLERLRTQADLLERTREVERSRLHLQDVLRAQFDPLLLMVPVRSDAGDVVDMRCEEVNNAACQLWGQSRVDLVDTRMSELIPAHVLDIVMADCIQIMATGEAIHREAYPFVMPDDGTIYFDVSAVATAGGVSITFREVTARHEAAEALAASEARYRLLAEHASDIVMAFDEDGYMTWASDSATAATGWTPAELRGRHANEIWHPDDRARTDESVQASVQGRAVPVELRLARQDGTFLWVEALPRIVETPTGPMFVSGMRVIDAEVRVREALNHALGHDDLTGMSSRAIMVERIADALDRLPDQGSASVLCVGIDRLSDINDAYTHSAGDLVIASVAASLAELVGNPDRVARSAGVEFLVLLPDLPAGDEPVRLAEEILARAKGPIPIGDGDVDVTVSIGISVGGRHDDAEQMVRDASAALARAKSAGRDQYAVADVTLAERARHRLEVEHRIRDYLAEDRFLPFFQPIVDLSTGQLVGYEALARALRPDLTIAPPSEFLPISELSPLVCDIDVTILAKAIRALSSLPGHLSMAINLSTVTLTRPGYGDIVHGLIRDSDIEPRRIHLEVTETALLHESAHILGVVNSTSQLGARWYVDDFGTGFSSISHLRELPVAGLKLDVSFSRGIREGDTKSRKLAQALAGLAMGLGLDTVAEGIEGPAEAEFLASLGWRHGQGYLYGRPAPLP